MVISDAEWPAALAQWNRLGRGASKHRHVCFTHNIRVWSESPVISAADELLLSNFTVDSFNTYFRDAGLSNRVLYMAAQLEVGISCGRLHVQGYVHFAGQITKAGCLAAEQGATGGRNGYWEPMRSTPEAATAYATKPSSEPGGRVAGTEPVVTGEADRGGQVSVFPTA